MFSKLIETIEKVQRFENISTVRKAVLQPLIENIQSKYSKNQVVNLNFICTHNSRRSHLTQIWAQVDRTDKVNHSQRMKVSIVK